ncbi:putative late blight resistance protein homolog R1A-10 [Apium graveolens]|uniref:putative late blight resistance protein homolog R1A-10 n=1 Tax=Apium graveolens TaxID=4045 RepID=UPI003D7B106A
MEGEDFVGFQVEVDNLLRQLASFTKKKLEVISIVGMPGVGKTTLARKLFNDAYVVSYFYVRAWITCSRVHHKRELLLSILRSVAEITDEVCRMNDCMLAHELYRALKGRRYLIVIDNIWSTEAWDDFKSCFPDDNNGSRIMLTTRLKDVALHAHPDGNPLCLRFLTEEESFDLFRRKVLVTGNDSDNLSSIGQDITRKCRGLPLAIVVIAGLLKNEFEVDSWRQVEMDWWLQVSGSINSLVLGDENHYMDTLSLSYNHLPQHLRPCFLSFGAFRENSDIPVNKLIWSWIAEGFIVQDGTKKSLERVAENYLMDLVRRSLVVVGKKGCNGEIKTCSIHNLLRSLCLRIAKEENFAVDIYKYDKHSRLCRNKRLIIPYECSCYSSEISQSFFMDVSIHQDSSKLIRALDISSIELFVFPCELLQLVQLRYLELRFKAGYLPESISQLRELQTLIMHSKKKMVVPKNMWKMKNLRHLRIKSGGVLVNFPNLEEEPNVLENLQTISLITVSKPCQNILAKTRNLKKLGLCGPLEITQSGDMKCLDLGLLKHLETLKLLYTIPLCKAGRLGDSIKFPESLKSLLMSITFLDWKEDWIFKMIPNLEVLKLKVHAFSGKDWETRPEAFPRLKFLKLEELDIMTWTATRNHFPVLRHLQVYRCSNLMEIPEDFGNIIMLEVIELGGCSDAAANSARHIQKEQEICGNDCLKIVIKPGLTSSQTNQQNARSG